MLVPTWEFRDLFSIVHVISAVSLGLAYRWKLNPVEKYLFRYSMPTNIPPYILPRGKNGASCSCRLHQNTCLCFNSYGMLQRRVYFSLPETIFLPEPGVEHGGFRYVYDTIMPRGAGPGNPPFSLAKCGVYICARSQHPLFLPAAGLIIIYYYRYLTITTFTLSL